MNVIIRRSALVVALAASSTLSLGYVSEYEVALLCPQIEIKRLAPTILAESAGFVVDDSAQISFIITASAPSVSVSIEGPAAQMVDSSNVATYGGTYEAMGDLSSQTGMTLGRLLEPGYHQWFALPTLGSGTYTVHLSAPPGLQEDIAVITRLELQSPVKVALFAREYSINTGSTATLALVVVDGDSAVTGATITAEDVSASATLLPISFMDDGVGADGEAGDGLYTAVFAPTEIGKHIVTAIVTGTTSLGTPFRRHISTSIDVYSSCAVLQGSPVFSTVDADNNGLYEKMSVEVSVDVSTAATFILHGLLTTPSGHTFRAYVKRELPAGLNTLVASVRAEDIVAAAEHGPYTLTSLELLCDTEEAGAVPSDRLLDIDLASPAYLWTEFERDQVRLTDVFHDQPLDIEDDCQMRPDVLSVEFEVIVRQPGIYKAVARLNGPDYEFIADGTNEQVSHNIPADVPVTLAIWFSAADIYQKGIDGPYLVSDFLFSGNGQVVFRSGLTQTSEYDVDLFEPYPDVDCNSNDIPDECDIQLGTSSDCQNDEIPDDCQLTGNDSLPEGGDGIPDECNCTVDATCDDGDACNGVEYCSLNICYPGLSPICSDQTACTQDSCHPVLGCRYIGNPAVCGTPPECKFYSCVSGVGCVLNLMANGICCDDDSQSTICDRCTNGRCTGIKGVGACEPCGGNPEE